MIPEAVDLRALLDFATRLARDAGAITHRYFKGSFTAERKADNSFVTAADREAERFLRAGIEVLFPQMEFSARRRTTSRVLQIVSGYSIRSMALIHLSIRCRS
jgi:3'-phosphoadenosine 5'-phosphosulfate (PAPS) 3'-phosphatase